MNMDRQPFEYAPFVPPALPEFPPFNPTPEQWKRGQQVAALLLKGLTPSDCPDVQWERKA